jgi:Trypsin-co-occurring domain 1
MQIAHYLWALCYIRLSAKLVLTYVQKVPTRHRDCCDPRVISEGGQFMPVIQSTVPNNDGTISIIYIEVDETQGVSAINAFADTRGGQQVVSDVFNKGMDLIRTCAEQIVTTVKKVELMARPDEFEVQLSIKLDSQIGAILAKTGAEAQLQVRIKWAKSELVRGETGGLHE